MLRKYYCNVFHFFYLVWDKPFVFGLGANGVEVLRSSKGQFGNPQKLPKIDRAKYLVRLNEGTPERRNGQNF